MSETTRNNSKPLPTFNSDEAAEHFVDTADLSEYDLSGFRPFSSEFRYKTARVNMRLPPSQLNAVKAAAARRGIPYQRFIREAIERALQSIENQ